MSARPAHEALGLRFDGLSVPARAALAAALAALWLLGRRYAGISHDATLYLGQGLRRLHPEALAGDLFFAHGGQDGFTVFPLLYAPLIHFLGPGPAAMLLDVAGQAAFLALAVVLVRQTVPPGAARWWSLALLAVTSGYYGGVGTFRFAEPFATARVLAEPAVLAAIACLLAGRLRACAAALLAAVLLHPLVAAAGIGTVIVWHALDRKRFRWIAAGIVIAAALWVFSQPRFDPAWREAVLERSPHLFVALWQVPDWARLAWGLGITGLAARFAAPPLRRLLIIVAAIAIAGVAASWIAVDLLDSVAAAALQAWRAHWLLHFLALIQVPCVVVALWRGSNAGRAAAVCVAASCCFGRSGQPGAAVLVALAALLHLAELRSPAWMGPRALRGVSGAAACAAAVGLLLAAQERLPALYDVMAAPGWRDYAAAGTTVGGLVPLAVVLWVLAHTRFAGAALAVSAAALAMGVSAWDARTPWQHFLEGRGAETNPFRARIAPGGEVFWRESGGPTWLLLRAPNWFSVDQGAGIVFSRETAMEYAARKVASDDLRAALDVCGLAGARECRIERRVVDSFCARERAPAYLVLTAPVEQAAATVWKLPTPVGRGWRALYLYSCAEIKKAGGKPAF